MMKDIEGWYYNFYENKNIKEYTYNSAKKFLKIAKK